MITNPTLEPEPHLPSEANISLTACIASLSLSRIGEPSEADTPDDAHDMYHITMETDFKGNDFVWKRFSHSLRRI